MRKLHPYYNPGLRYLLLRMQPSAISNSLTNNENFRAWRATNVAISVATLPATRGNSPSVFDRIFRPHGRNRPRGFAQLAGRPKMASDNVHRLQDTFLEHLQR